MKDVLYTRTSGYFIRGALVESSVAVDGEVKAHEQIHLLCREAFFPTTWCSENATIWKEWLCITWLFKAVVPKEHCLFSHSGIWGIEE